MNPKEVKEYIDVSDIPTMKPQERQIKIDKLLEDYNNASPDKKKQIEQQIKSLKAGLKKKNTWTRKAYEEDDEETSMTASESKLFERCSDELGEAPARLLHSLLDYHESDSNEGVTVRDAENLIEFLKEQKGDLKDLIGLANDWIQEENSNEEGAINKDANMDKKAFEYDNVEHYIDFLERTLIPYLKESGKEATAEDFYRLTKMLKNEEVDWELIDSLEKTLIPYLKESGTNSLAEDFEEGIKYYRQAVKKAGGDNPKKKASSDFDEHESSKFYLKFIKSDGKEFFGTPKTLGIGYDLSAEGVESMKLGDKVKVSDSKNNIVGEIERVNFNTKKASVADIYKEIRCLQDDARMAGADGDNTRANSLIEQSHKLMEQMNKEREEENKHKKKASAKSAWNIDVKKKKIFRDEKAKIKAELRNHGETYAVDQKVVLAGCLGSEVCQIKQLLGHGKYVLELSNGMKVRVGKDIIFPA